jgi:hypothetical protein
MYECETLACELELFFVKTRSETQVIYHSSRITHEESRLMGKVVSNCYNSQCSWL